MASPTRWTWVWINSGSWWWTGRPGVLQFMGPKRVGHDWATELNWTEMILSFQRKVTIVSSQSSLPRAWFMPRGQSPDLQVLWKLFIFQTYFQARGFLARAPNYCQQWVPQLFWGCCLTKFSVTHPLLWKPKHDQALCDANFVLQSSSIWN